MLGRGWICVFLHASSPIHREWPATYCTYRLYAPINASRPVPPKDHGEPQDNNNPIPRETRPLRVVPRNISQTRSKVMHALVIEAQPGRNKKQGIKNLSLVACR